MKEPKSVHDEIVLLLTKIGVLEKRNARLREALEKIANIPLWDEFECTKIARAALAENKLK